MTDKLKQEQSQRELDTLAFEDVIVNLNSLCEQYGARQVFTVFRDAYPEMYEEIVIQINRLPPQRQVAALLR